MRAVDSPLFGHHDVHREQRRRRRVDRHRRRHLVERKAVEQHVHVLDRIDRDADSANLTERARRVGVDAHLGRQVERDAQAGLPGGEQMSKPAVRFRRRPEAGVLAHRPEPSAVHRRLHAARERILAGIGEVARVVERRVRRPVDGLDREARRRIHGIRHSVEANWRSSCTINRRMRCNRTSHPDGCGATGGSAFRASSQLSTRSFAVNRSRLSAFLLVAGLVPASVAMGQASKRPMSFDDIMDLKNVGTVALSPDASAIAYTVSAWEHPNARAASRRDRSPTRPRAIVTTFARTSGSCRRPAARRDSSRSANAASRRRRGRPTDVRSRFSRRAAPART